MVAAGVDISLILRVMAFGVTICLGLVYDFLCSRRRSYLISSHSRLVGLKIKGSNKGIQNLIFAPFGTIFFFIFATQKDIIELWRSWSESCIRFMFVETDVNFRALALINRDSPKTERSSDRSRVTRCETIE